MNCKEKYDSLFEQKVALVECTCCTPNFPKDFGKGNKMKKGLKIRRWFGYWRVRDSLNRIGKPMEIKGVLKKLKRLADEKENS